jgi:SAM-dependent methyltransferase
MRDTDRDWSLIAQTSPYYGVLTNPQYLNPTAEALKEFFQSGQADIDYYFQKIQQVFGEFKPNSALDFGCGVGRLVIPLARLAGRAVGVDIAEGMRNLATQHSLEAGVSVTVTESIPANEKFDWVNSQIVLQHIPPRRGYGIIRDLWASVAKGGLLVLQLTMYKESTHLDELARDIRLLNYDGECVINYTDYESNEQGGMSMYDYDLSRVFSAIPMNNGCPVYMEKTCHGVCHGMIIYIQKRE